MRIGILNSKIIVFVCILCFGSYFTKGQEITFKHIGTREGLSQSSVSSIVQDPLGRIWMGTRDGLNLYDGSSIKAFRPIRGDSTSLLGHFITKIVEDGEYLWVISRSGLSRLHIKTQRFERFPIIGQTSLVRYQGNILLGTNDGLFDLNIESKSVKKNTKYLAEGFIIQDFYADNLGNLWICTNEGLYLYFQKTNETKRILGVNSTNVFIDSKDRVWVGTYNNGVYLLDEYYNIHKHYQSGDSIFNLASNTIRDIEEDLSGNIWIGTFLGLSVIYPADNYAVKNYVHNENDFGSLSHNSILSITKDKQGGMWLGTYFGGVNYYHPEFNIFQTYPKASEGSKQKKALGFNVIGEIIEADNGDLFIATEGGGIDLYNRNARSFQHFKLNEERGQARMNINVKALLFMHDDTLLVGTHLAGLKKLNVKTGVHKTYLPVLGDSSTIPSNIVEEIIPYKKDLFLLGTKEGVILFNVRTETFSYFISDEIGSVFNKRVNCLLIDRFGVLWIGTMDQGLYAYDPQTQELKTYVSTNDLATIGSNNISYIYEDHFFRLWFGTHGGGLSLFNREGDTFQNFNIDNSDLSSNFIQGIEKSRQGNLWVSTSKGLSLFDLTNQRFYNLSEVNGFPSKEPNHRSIYLTSDGELFVGGIDGLVSFKEEDLFNRTNNFNLIFSSLEVNGQLVTPNDSTQILKHDFAFTDSIKLNPNQQFFTIHFAAGNYVSTRQFNYRYRLDDEHDWVNIQHQNSLTFSKLPPGTYNLRVQAMGSGMETVIGEASLFIAIQAPWYRSWYAILGYCIFLFLAVGTLLRIYKDRIRVVNELKSEQREKEQLQQLNQAKLTFFTHVSHEFKTPLTIIMGLLETVQEKPFEKGVNTKIKKSLDNVYRLDYLVNELMDFRRLEGGEKKLNLKRYVFNDLLRSVFDLFVETAKQKSICYELRLPPEEIYCVFDFRQLEKVYFNLISNAFKFVKDGKGEIIVEAWVENDQVYTSVKDNGIGINQEDIDKVFDPYYQVEQTQDDTFWKGSGIGLAITKEIVNLHNGNIKVDSRVNEYTVFYVGIPLLNGAEVPVEETAPTKKYAEAEELKGVATMISGDTTEENEGEVILKKDGQKILIVEDNKEVQRLIVDILGKEYDLLLCNNAKEGLDMAFKEPPELIISDIMMPGMPGTEMCAILKRNIETCHIPIILLTAKSSVEAQLEGFACGADIYIPKPFRADILKVRVKNVLQNRELIQKRFRSDPNMEVKEVASNSIDERFLERAKEVVEENISNPEFNVHDFADAMNLGKSKFYTKVKSITGQTPNEFILSVRLKKAAFYMMGDEDLTISEVAYSVGYNDPRYFSKSFRQFYGVSPSQYGKTIKDRMQQTSSGSTDDSKSDDV